MTVPMSIQIVRLGENFAFPDKRAGQAGEPSAKSTDREKYEPEPDQVVRPAL
jgi:hypothetical protein